ncbi:MAG: hypothetical protein BWY39_01704 [Spirochaetes bacterium ADurb.Bin269]|nr:MAG: hypothetical protein BWY39_01704 [Spirochaetes bacterium ADurb.Bin269]
MGNQYNAQSARTVPAKGGKKGGILSGGQNGCRFVEDQKIRGSHQRCEHGSIKAFRRIERTGFSRKIQFDAPVFGDRAYTGFCLFQLCAKAACAEQNVFRHSQFVAQQRPLMHHRNAVSDSLGRRHSRELAFTYGNYAARRLVKTRQNVHQGRFPCAVFAENGVHFAGIERKRDVVERGQAAYFFA